MVMLNFPGLSDCYGERRFHVSQRQAVQYEIFPIGQFKCRPDG